MATFEANGEIGQMVNFVPTFKQATEMGITAEELYGEIVSIRFTKAKVWYDVLCGYYGIVFEKIPSEKVRGSEVNMKLKELENN